MTKDPLIHFPFYCHQYLGRLLQFSFEERGLFITALAIVIVEDGDISNEILLRRCGFKNQSSENNLQDNLAYLLQEVKFLAGEIIAEQKQKREVKRINGSKGGRRPKPIGSQAVNKNNRKASYTETEKETDTETELEIKTDSENFNESKSIDEFHISIANQLAEHIKATKQISIGESKINSWIKEIYLLEKQDLQSRQSPFDDIQKAIEAIKKHDGEEFFPTIESGESLRQKFSKIESFLQRQNPKSKTQQALEAFVAGGADDIN